MIAAISFRKYRWQTFPAKRCWIFRVYYQKWNCKTGDVLLVKFCLKTNNSMFHISIIHHISVPQSFSVLMMVCETKGTGNCFAMQRQATDYHSLHRILVLTISIFNMARAGGFLCLTLKQSRKESFRELPYKNAGKRVLLTEGNSHWDEGLICWWLTSFWR